VITPPAWRTRADGDIIECGHPIIAGISFASASIAARVFAGR
jgi:hypothetical protein